MNSHFTLSYGCLLLALVCACSSSTRFDLAITGVSILNTRTKELKTDQTICIQEGQIALIAAGDVQIDAEKTLKAPGMLVVPGFIDTHIHLTDIFGDGEEAPSRLLDDSIINIRKKFANTYLRYGVTTVADMGQPEAWLDVTLKWQQDSNPLYPDLFNTGSALISDDASETYLGHIVVRSPIEAKAKVTEYHSKGIQHLKAYWRLGSSELKSVTKMADSLGMKLYAHIDEHNVPMGQAANMGIRHFQHANTLSNDAFEFDRQGLGLIRIMEEHYPTLNCYWPFALEKIKFVDDHDFFRNKRDRLTQHLINHNCTLSTTLHTFAAFCRRTYFQLPDDNFQLSDRQLARLNEALDTFLEIVRNAHEKGLTLRIGTDCKAGGKAFLSELLLLAEAGIPMADILQIATWNGAQALGVQGDRGSVEVGKKADLVIFHQNPLLDPRHILMEKTIIKNGKVYHPTKDMGW